MIILLSQKLPTFFFVFLMNMDGNWMKMLTGLSDSLGGNPISHFETIYMVFPKEYTQIQ